MTKLKNNIQQGKLTTEEAIKMLIGTPTALRVPSEITIDIDNRLYDRFDELLADLNAEEALLGVSYCKKGEQTLIPITKQLSDGTKYQYGYYNQRDYYVLVVTDGETKSERHNHPTTRRSLPKQYNMYFAHCWKMVEQASYCYYYQKGELPTISL